MRIFSQTLNLLTADKVVNRHTAYMDSFVRTSHESYEIPGQMRR